ncbi:MAG: oligosaccharide flippase family protein [Moorea sp. SIO1G6]|uniref:oligosaccharide flippase family protein n=1 Tax=unclassified Moorena TaxID=2683338 RepID=UPI0013BBC71E|nr:MULTISPECIES: oligosaccharide flippase family protein [unclassified Moorena]NEQ09763.1 oligosaccharide flippase family protein [Moorena sp. SIO4E2]NET64105.1 oligosaccharide flippase family protein [Moorena sp. SIO1G6]
MNFQSLKSRLIGIFQKSLVRNTLWMLLAKFLKMIVQAAYFVIIARTLGAQQYGLFASLTALAAIISPFATWGSGDVLIKNVSRNRALFKEYWGNALLMVFTSSLVLIALVMLIAPAILPQGTSPLLIFLVFLSDLLFLKILATAGQAFIAVSQLKHTAQIHFLLSLKNLVATLCFVSFFQTSDIVVWAALYLASTAIAAGVGFLMVHRMLGTPKLAISKIKPEMLQGFYFSVNLCAETVNNNVDKTMLARLSTLQATGIYAAAYRLIDVAFVPVQSLLAASYAKFFQKGAAGIRGSLNLSKRLSPIAGMYGIAAGIGLFISAPMVPYIIGEDYSEVVNALRWLAPIPFFKAMQFFAADTLTGAGFQGLRSSIQVTAALLNFSLNLWLIPLYSWKGAAWSSLTSDSLRMLSLWLLVFVLYRQEVTRSKRLQESEH